MASGSNGKLTPVDLTQAREAFTNASVLLLQLETPLVTVEAAAEIASETGTRILLNPAPAQKLPASLLQRLISHHAERNRSGVAHRRSRHRFFERGKAAVYPPVERRAERDYHDGQRRRLRGEKELGQMVPGFKVNAIDTVAAGDVFNGALAVALAEGKSCWMPHVLRTRLPPSR